ncbi:MAG: isoaspartyl peptidase/L-asparaginase [Chthoniobacter sp.]
MSLQLSPAAEPGKYGLVIHGGAGTYSREREKEYLDGLNAALDAGYAVLDQGGTSVEAVVAAVKSLEDNPTFNAGCGAVLNSEGFCELDSAVMDGQTLAAGAVAGVQHIRNPITLAVDVMKRSPHVLLAGEGAEHFAFGLGYEKMPREYFITPRRKEQWERERAKKSGASRGNIAGEEKFWGTVGCVALDRQGNLAAGTSTGGLTNKMLGRVGDSPLIGAGTYANNATCAVSATGQGEFFIRTVATHDIAARIAYRGASLSTATAEVIAEVEKLGGTGGVIAINRAGEIAMPYNTDAMCRAYRLSDGQRATQVFADRSHSK